MFEQVLPGLKMSKEPAQKLDSSALKITQAAKLLGVSRSTLLRLEESDRINSKRLPNGYRIFEKDAVLELKNLLEIDKKEVEKTKIDTKIVPVSYKKAKVIKAVTRPTAVPTGAKKPDAEKIVPAVLEPKFEPAHYHLTHLAQRPPKGLNFDTIIRVLLKTTIGLGLLTALLSRCTHMVCQLNTGLPFCLFGK